MPFEKAVLVTIQVLPSLPMFSTAFSSRQDLRSIRHLTSKQCFSVRDVQGT